MLISCPNCGEQYDVSPDRAGQVVQCAKCCEEFTIPPKTFVPIDLSAVPAKNIVSKKNKEKPVTTESKKNNNLKISKKIFLILLFATAFLIVKISILVVVCIILVKNNTLIDKGNMLINEAQKICKYKKGENTEKFLKIQLDLAKHSHVLSKKILEKTLEQHEEDNYRMERLKKINTFNHLLESEKDEVKQSVAVLKSNYNDIKISIDSKTGKAIFDEKKLKKEIASQQKKQVDEKTSSVNSASEKVAEIHTKIIELYLL